VSAFANCGRAVAHVRGSYVPTRDMLGLDGPRHDHLNSYVFFCSSCSVKSFISAVSRSFVDAGTLPYLRRSKAMK
jgi:hypothetical protein